MNVHQCKSVVVDAWLGIWRNKLATIGAILLMVICLVSLTVFLMTRVLFQDVRAYVDSQVSLKVYVSTSVDTEDVAAVLEKQPYVESLSIEKGDDTLKKLAFFFEEKKTLLEAFERGKVNDAIQIELKDGQQMAAVAQKLETIDAIEKVVYPQSLATYMQQASQKMTLYSTITLLILFVCAFTMLFVTSHSTVTLRQKELKVKLLVGMNPAVLRVQFYIESILLTLMSSLLSFAICIGLYNVMQGFVDTFIPFLTGWSWSDIWMAFSISVLSIMVVALVAYEVTTRKWLRHG